MIVGARGPQTPGVTFRCRLRPTRCCAIANPEVDRNRYRTASFFPDDLSDLQHGPTWAEWQLYDRSSGQGGRTAVNNWLRYSERMNFIGNVFRSRQQLTGLYHTPESRRRCRRVRQPLIRWSTCRTRPPHRLQQTFGAES